MPSVPPAAAVPTARPVDPALIIAWMEILPMRPPSGDEPHSGENRAGDVGRWQAALEFSDARLRPEDVPRQLRPATKTRHHENMGKSACSLRALGVV
jgi:hypothetical protein